MTLHSDLFVLPFADAVYYLREVQDAHERNMKLHHMKLKAAYRRCFETPVYSKPTTVTSQANTLAAILADMAWYKHGSLPQVFCVYTAMKYCLEVLQTYHGEASMIEKDTKMGPVLLDRAIDIRKTAVENLEGGDPSFDHPLTRELFARLIEVCDKTHELYSALLVPEYQKTKCVETTQRFKEQLMQKACHPKRLQWWMDFEEYQEIFGTTNM